MIATCRHARYAPPVEVLLPCAHPGCRAGAAGEALIVLVADSFANGRSLKFERERIGRGWRWRLAATEHVDLERIRREQMAWTMRCLFDDGA